MTRFVNPARRLRLERFEDRIVPATYMIDGTGDEHWDQTNHQDEPRSTAGTITIRSALEFHNQYDEDLSEQPAELQFAGPMTITVTDEDRLPSIKKALTVTGISQAGSPQVSIVGSGQNSGFLLLAGSSVRDIHIAGFDINLFLAPDASGVTIANNYIGTDKSGTAAGPGDSFGIISYDATNDLTVQGNLISGNARGGIAIINSVGVTISGNTIGTDKSRQAAIPNRYGIKMDVNGAGSKFTDNTIAGNSEQGIWLTNTFGVELDGNTVGLEEMGNQTGIEIEASQEILVGYLSGNTVAWNLGAGLKLSNSDSCSIFDSKFNHNGGDGLTVIDGANHLIRFSEFSFNQSNGINFRNDVRDSKIQDFNIISYNGMNGVFINGVDNVVGAVNSFDTRHGNAIEFNSKSGVVIVGQSSVRNAIRLNRISGNGQLGIDLGDDGRDLPDRGDGDTGPNNRQNYANIIRPAEADWLLSGPPNTTFLIDIYLKGPEDGTPSGWIFITGFEVFTDQRGFATIHVNNISSSNEHLLTVTDSSGNTSEFSPLDGDADNIPVEQEQLQGIDANGDGTPEAPLPGANPNVPNLFVELDAMEGFAPLPGVVEAVVAKFAARGINLHVEVSDTNIPRAALGADYWTAFHDIKRQYFGPSGTDTPAGKARLQAYRYVLFADTYGDANDPNLYFSPGAAEHRGNDFFVTLGSISKTVGGDSYAGFADAYPIEQRAELQQGLFMHLLGHVLGLADGGPADWDAIPTANPPLERVSVMNPARRFPGSTNAAGQTAEFTLDYSADEWAGLWNLFHLSPWATAGSDPIALGDPNQYREPPGFGTELPPPPAAAFAVGAGSGSGLAQVLNPDKSVRLSVEPFPGFTGGVRVASADFNRDGHADLVVGTGPGRATRIVILSGADQSELFAIDPFEAAFTGGVYVAVGDLDGDGVPDLIITPDEGGGPRVRILSGDGFGQIADFFGIDDPNFRGGARAAIGDVNADGRPDLIVAAGFGGGPRVAIYDGSRLGESDRPKLVGDFFAFESTLTNGIFVAVGDVDGDGFAEVIAGGGPGGGPRVSVFDGRELLNGTLARNADFFAGDVNNRGGVRLAVKRLDADNRIDLLAGSGSGGGSRVTAYAGATLVGEEPPELFGFDAFPGFTGGLFVG